MAGDYLNSSTRTLLQQKSRMISFRLSEEEFRTLKEVSAGQGFGSLSDLVRTAVQEMISSRPGPGLPATHNTVQSLIARIGTLERDLKELVNCSNAAPRCGAE